MNKTKINNNIIKTLNEGNLIKVKKLIKKIEKIPLNKNDRKIKVGIIRTFSIEAQVDYIKLAFRLISFQAEIKVLNIDNIEQEILDLDSDLFKWKPDIILIFWRLEELIPIMKSYKINLTLQKYKTITNNLKKRISKMISMYDKITNVPLIISTMPLLYENDLYDMNNKISLRKLYEEINLYIFSLINKYFKISIFDFNLFFSSIGKSAYDRKMDFYVRQPISHTSMGYFSIQIVRSVKPFFLPPSKAIALDADNVLWGGIVGEDGINNLKIGEDFPGNVYLAIQEFVLKLKKRGFLVFLLSKNNKKDLLNVFKEIDSMPLKISDFDHVEVNWKNKYINIKKISKDFNIGLDSFVFVDDQKFEREQMKFNVPEVETLEVSEDPINILTSLENCWNFDILGLSQEDSLRSLDYKFEQKRKLLKNSFKNKEDFLTSLNLKAQITSVKNKDLPRAFQLLSKTNQFNLRTQRYTEAEVKNLYKNSNNVFLKLSLSDKFNSQGIVGIILGVKINKETIFVDSFLLSCRAIGRDAEKALWSVFVNKINELKIKKLTAEFIQSKKNFQVSNLYEDLGLNLVKKDRLTKKYELDLPTKYKKPNWIIIK